MKTPLAPDRLKTCCAEILAWQATGKLPYEAELRAFASELTEVPEHHRMNVAQMRVADQAMQFVIENVKG